MQPQAPQPNPYAQPSPAAPRPMDGPAQPPTPPAPAAQPPTPAGDYPVQVDIAYPPRQSRILALFSLPFFLVRLLALIPHLIILYFVQIAAAFAAWLNFWVILFTGHSSQGLHNYVVGATRWSTRVNSYELGLTDKYPPFRLKP